MLVYLIHKLTCMQFSRYNHWLISLSLTAYMKYKPMGLSGLEPPTSRLSGVRSNRLSYKPILNLAATCSPTPSPVQYHRPLRS